MEYKTKKEEQMTFKRSKLNQIAYFDDFDDFDGYTLGSGRPGFGFGLPRQAPDLTF